MARIVMTDDGLEFDGATPDHRPVGGAEAAFLSLAEAFAARGHAVRVCNNCAAPLARNGVEWTPIADGVPEECDLYIGNRGHRLIGLAPRARGRAFWLHNPGGYLLKPRYLWPLLRVRPTIVVTGNYHASTVPWWVPCAGRAVIPYGLGTAYREATARADVPPPVAIFTSNPLRGLDWLLDLWSTRIRPAVPRAELHIYAGPQVYGAVGARKADRMAMILERAEALVEQGVRCHAPVPKPELVGKLRAARVMLYRGDENETFCLAVAEAQALGLPAVVMPLGSLPERVEDGVTGTVAKDDDAFAAAATALLTDDALWQYRHQAAIARQKGLSWGEVAARFEALMP
ncbi:MAG TPA: glycosyltransferase [Stellaceae bacterium]|nr:glycosyltransferase [Stellaceae bacterium]